VLKTCGQKHALGYTVLGPARPAERAHGLDMPRFQRIPSATATLNPRGYAINGAAVEQGVQRVGASEFREESGKQARSEIHGYAAETAEEKGRAVPPEESAASHFPLTAGSEDASRFCPVCSQRLESRRCKLICNVCGYFMSCADYY
jgi:hypothetical protein